MREWRPVYTEYASEYRGILICYRHYYMPLLPSCVEYTYNDPFSPNQYLAKTADECEAALKKAVDKYRLPIEEITK